MPNTVSRNYTLVLACIGGNISDESIISEAFKTAKKNNAEWQILNIITPENEASQSNKLFLRMLKKAEILGAEIVEVKANSIEDAVLKYSMDLGSEEKVLFVTRLDEELKLPLLYKKSSSSKLKQALNDKNIDIKGVAPQKQAALSSPMIMPIFSYNAVAGVLESVIYIFIASLISLIFISFIPNMLIFTGIGDLYLIFLVACVMSAFRAGALAGVLCSIISVITINFFFIEPRLTFTPVKPQDIMLIATFLSCALVASIVSGATRKYIIEAKQKEAYLNTLLNVSETLNRPLQELEALAYIYDELKKLFVTELAFYGHSLMGGDVLSLKYPEVAPVFSEIEQQAFNKCQSEYINTGFLTANEPESKWFFEPMLSSNGFKGILAIKLAESPLRFDSNITNILLSFADFSATLIDRIERTLSLEEDRIESEKEQLRTSLLSSVSHDLKTPLASIIGSLDVYESLNTRLTEENKKTLLQTAHQEAVRLDNFITNILDMAKLESGSVKINKRWVKLSGIIDKALVTISPRFKDRKITNTVLIEDPEVNVEPTLITRSLVNILDNISKYTPIGTDIDVDYEMTNAGLNVIISDQGPGIEDHALEQIFDKYTRIKQQDNKIAGTGLGLPIARFILRAHGGDIVAANKEKGMSFTLVFPEYKSDEQK